MPVGMLFDRVGAEEKLLIKAFKDRDTDLELIDVRQASFRLDDPKPWKKFDVVFDRCVSFSKALASLQILNGWGIATVNSAAVADTCGSKLATSVALERDGVATPHVAIAYSAESALAAIEKLGYPVVLKPAVGSWGRLLSKVNDRDAAEALLEHKATLGSYNHSVFYIQQFVEKSAGQDIRSFVVDGETICAITRRSQHWITNTARGATTANYPVCENVDRLSRQAAQAVGGGLLAIDLFEDQNGNWLVNEVNHSMEFRNSIAPTGVDIAGKMVDYVLQVGQRELANHRV